MPLKPKISLVVPHWPKEPHHDELLRACIKSMPEADEKIIIVNDGTGMGRAINKGLELSTGDFIIVANNDTRLILGSLYDMCNDTSITLPNNMDGQWELPRSFFCLPRWVYETVGGYDEQFGVGYFEDDDLIKRWRDAHIPFRMTQVSVEHHPGTTLGKLDNADELYKKNKERYYAKWGEYPNGL